MTELLIKNLDIIQQRWPILASALRFQKIDELDAQLVIGQNQTISVNGIQLSSRHNRIAEAELLINNAEFNKQKVTVYGVGMGDVPSVLVDDLTIVQLEVNLLNLQLFALLLSYTDQTEWLSDDRVSIIHNPPQDSFDETSIAIAPELILASDDNASLRDLLALEKNRDYANKQHAVDDPKLLQRFKENQLLLEQDLDATVLMLNQPQIKAHVIGAGPSLEQHYSYLNAQRMLPVEKRPLLIAVDTAFKALMSEGIIPDIVVSIESNIAKMHFPDEIPNSVKLVYFPRVPNEVLLSWPGERFNAYSKSPIYDALDRENPKLRLFTNGSVIHPAIDLAIYLQTKEITLFGCDFSYPNNKTHAFWKDGALGPKVEDAKHWIINGHGERVATDLNFKTYLRSLEHYIRSKPHIKFYQSSLEGALIHGAQYKECKA